MAKNDRKKKSTAKKNPAHVEQERRRRLNEWKDLLRRICVSQGVGDLFDAPTQWERFYFETYRFSPFQLRKAPGHDIPKEVFAQLESLLKNAQETHPVIIPGGLRLPCGDYLRAVSCLRAFHHHCTRGKDERFARWVAALDPLLEFDHSTEKGLPPLLSLWSLMCYFAALAGDMDKEIYPVLFQHERRYNPDMLLYYFEVSTLPAQHRTFTVGKERRRSFRLFFQSVYSMQVSPGELSSREIPGMQDQEERLLPVFVQDHVRQRMIERLAPFDPIEIDHLLGDTMRFKRTIPGGRPGTFLISLEMYQCRLGYVVAEVIDDAVLMRTFLFVTQSGTPEGDRLNERLRVGKYEKTYFGIDRLSLFLTTDLCMDPAFRGILTECGIDDLIKVVEINRELRSSLRTKEGYAEKLRHWLNLDVEPEKPKVKAASNPPAEEPPSVVTPAEEPPSEAACESDPAPPSAPDSIRRIRILRRGLRRPITSFVRRPRAG
ncbi:MAG: hypothetical protein CVU59_00160 [Deltaproteobacteria bacterium HGW-Deltaproteobacteria-17]|nr:MAG: hypothetical protein CVU59_00160 [Deltaproteobacteria bacterium HGW-Deltaproteobacteria-17]